MLLVALSVLGACWFVGIGTTECICEKWTSNGEGRTEDSQRGSDITIHQETIGLTFNILHEGIH